MFPIHQVVSIILFVMNVNNISFYDMYNNLHFHQILQLNKPGYQNLKFDNTYLPKGYLILVIPGIVSIDHVQHQNPQLYSTGIMLWII